MLLEDRPKIAYQDSACMLATWRSIVIPVIGSEPLSAPSARAQARALEAHAKVVGKGKLGEVTLIARDAPLPDADARAAFEAAVPTIAPYYACVSAVFEGTGFRAALVRGFITSLQILSRSKFPQKVFSSVDECAAWLFSFRKAMELPVSEAAEIAAAVRTVRGIAIERGVFGPIAASAAAAEPIPQK